MASEDKLNQLSNDLASYLPLLGQVAERILEQEISSYPIFVVFQGDQEIALGLPLIQPEAGSRQPWTVHISTLEEMAARQIVQMERVDRFRQVFKDPATHLCILVWDEGEARFVFLPR